jgi:molybdopterin/thiamine biosynthesis adenylyltransferase/rhodanese-related sulfurtransferase
MAETFGQRMRRLRKHVREVDVDTVREALDSADRPHIIDVREKNEFDDGYIKGATHVPRGYLEIQIEAAAPDYDKPIILYCAGGVRSVLAADTLQEMGYTNVVSMSGGFTRWKDAGFPFVVPRTFTPEQRSRYSRHILIPEVGEAGQMALLDARVLLIGAGGLGSPAALYLGAAGVGTLGIIDADVVDTSNLQRQILHTTGRVGQPKAESARETINALNPDVNVVPYVERLTRDNVLSILENYDVIVDGSDNFATRYLLNDVSLLTGKPLVYGSIFRFEGQVTSFVPGKGPCYRCLFPEAPPPELAPT